MEIYGEKGVFTFRQKPPFKTNYSDINKESPDFISIGAAALWSAL
jgi:hypothetical protein